MQKPAAAPESESNDINLTPMLDVVFIMLIFFIVTATFLKEQGIPLNRTDGAETIVSESESILVEIDADDKIFIGNRWIDRRAVRANIERLRSENPDALVIVQADQKSSNDTLVQVLNASREAGVYNVALAAQGH